MPPRASLPLRRADWLAARAALAGRRDARLGFASVFSVGLVFAVLYSATRAAPSVHSSLLSVIAASAIVGLIAGYAINLAREMARAHVADTREAERVVGAPVLAVINARAPRRAASGDTVDPYRLMYLSVSPAGERAHFVMVTGDDPELCARVATRIAHAAALDARATLVIDLDLERAPAAAAYRVRNEPGFSDALAGVRLWREVALAVGANTGLAIDLVPGGSQRRDTPDEATPEFLEFFGEYDFCVILAPGPRAMARAVTLLNEPLTVLCVQAGVTPLSSLLTWRHKLHDAMAKIHGIAFYSS